VRDPENNPAQDTPILVTKTGAGTITILRRHILNTMRIFKKLWKKKELK
jgi:hypothetical protein